MSGIDREGMEKTGFRAVRLLAASGLLGLAAIGCHEQDAKAPSGQAAEQGSVDAQLDERVERELRQQPVLREVSVSVRSGVVTLSGRVPGLMDRERVEVLVRRIEGVRDVENDLSATGAIDTSPRVDTTPGGA
ncbi:MAG: BON domain-containing protein [Myxococcota bacterium]